MGVCPVCCRIGIWEAQCIRITGFLCDFHSFLLSWSLFFLKWLHIVTDCILCYCLTNVNLLVGRHASACCYMAHSLHVGGLPLLFYLTVLLIGLPRFPQTACILRPQLINIQRLPNSVVSFCLTERWGVQRLAYGVAFGLFPTLTQFSRKGWFRVGAAFDSVVWALHATVV